MNQTIHFQHLQGIIQAPASKSSMQRALAASLLAIGDSFLYNISKSKDCLAAQQIIQDLGATVYPNTTFLHIQSNGFNPKTNLIQCGESGLALRMFASIAALHDGLITMTGRGSLMERKITFFDAHFPLFGVKASTNQGFLPLELVGKLKAAKATIDGTQSSQYLTGLLMALPLCEGDSELTVLNLNSKPYIDLTIHILNYFGISIQHQDYQQFYIKGGQQYISKSYIIEGDWSGAAFWLVGGAIGGSITIKGLQLASAQADKAILEVIEACGAFISINEEDITVEKRALKAFHFDATQCPDLFPPLVALASHCEGISSIYGVHRLVDKESNRAAALYTEFKKLGIEITIEEDTMYIKGGQMQSATCFSHNDHRIAMALAVASIGQTLQLEGAESVQKSYPHFWEDLELLMQ